LRKGLSVCENLHLFFKSIVEHATVEIGQFKAVILDRIVACSDHCTKSLIWLLLANESHEDSGSKKCEAQFFGNISETGGSITDSFVGFVMGI
jgi:hypothetical protein